MSAIEKSSPVTGQISALPSSHPQSSLSYTPTHLVEKILISRSALEGERKQVIVLFVDRKGSIESLPDRNPENERILLDPVLERLMAAVQHYEGTGNKVMGDDIMGLQEGSCDTTLQCCRGWEQTDCRRRYLGRRDVSVAVEFPVGCTCFVG